MPDNVKPPLTRPETSPVLVTASPFDAVTPRGAVTGAWLMGQIDIAAGLAGRRFSGGDALILAIKEMTFHAPLTAGIEFVIHAALTRRGNSSFNLFLSAWAEPDTASTLILSADVLLVAVDSHGKPRKIA